MRAKFDHLVIYVSNLEEAITDFTDLGFEVSRGGAHGATENALIIFSNQVYIELLAWVHVWYTPLLRTVNRLGILQWLADRKGTIYCRLLNIESERKWTALGAFNKIRDEWVDESKYVVPALTMFALIGFFEGFIESNEFIAGGIWVGVSYASYRVQKFFIYRKTHGVFDDFNDQVYPIFNYEWIFGKHNESKGMMSYDP